MPILLIFVLFVGVPAQSDILKTDWAMTSEDVTTQRPSALILETPQKTESGLIYKLAETVTLGTEHTFTAHYFFRETNDLLDLIVLELKTGLPGLLFEYYDAADLPSVVETELQVVRKTVVHEVHFTDVVDNNLIIYDRIGDDCTLIYKPIKRGNPF